MTQLLNPFISFPSCVCPPATVAGGWVEVGRTILMCAGDCIDINCLPNHRQYMILHHGISPGSSVSSRIRYNGCASGCNYTNRWSIDDGTDGTDINECQNYMTPSSYTCESFFSVGIVCNAQTCRLHSSHSMENSTCGAGNAPRRHENAGKWESFEKIIMCYKTFNSGASCFQSRRNGHG